MFHPTAVDSLHLFHQRYTVGELFNRSHKLNTSRCVVLYRSKVRYSVNVTASCNGIGKWRIVFKAEAPQAPPAHKALVPLYGVIESTNCLTKTYLPFDTAAVRSQHAGNLVNLQRRYLA